MPTPYTGGCGCGAIRYRVTAEPLISYLCHCTECQRRTSSAFGLNMQIPAESLVIEQGKPTSRTRIADNRSPLPPGTHANTHTDKHTHMYIYI